MASARPEPVDRPRQYWLDVARPIQTRLAPGRPASPPRARRQSEEAAAGLQMELRMSPPVIAPMAPGVVQPSTPDAEAPSSPMLPPPCFVTWLLGQGKTGGAIGELAKAARIAPSFPRSGSADAVRAQFSRAGADGDAFAALDDAELAYDRAVHAAGAMA